MLINVNTNPYKKLLKEVTQKQYESYDKKMKALADFFEKLRDELDKSVTEISYVQERCGEVLCLDYIRFHDNFDYNQYDFLKDLLDTLIISKVENFDFDESDYPVKGYSQDEDDYLKEKLIYHFIINNIRKEYGNRDLPLDGDIGFLDVDEEDEGIVLGYFAPGTEEYQIEYDEYSTIKINNRRVNLFDYVKKFPDEIFDELCEEHFYTDEFTSALSEIREGEDTVSILFSELGNDYASYPVGMEKSVFREKFLQFLQDEKLLFHSNTDNSVWEEEEEEE